MKTKILSGLLSLSLLGAGAASAQEFKLRTYSPGIKNTAGFLGANQRNTEDKVSKGVFSLPTYQLAFPSAIRGEPQELQLDIYALGASVSPTGFTTSLSSGVSPLVVKAEDCTGKTLTEGQFCSVVLQVDNADGRGSNTGLVRVLGTDSTGASISGGASLKWDVLAPQASLSKSSFSFGEVDVGAVSAPQFFVVRTGAAPLTISSLNQPSGFEISSVNCLTATGSVGSLPAVIRPVASGDYCEFGVIFKPGAAVAHQETMVVVDNDELLNTAVTLSGVGVAAKSYAKLLNRGKQSTGFTLSTDGLTLTKTGSFNNYARFVGSKLLASGKYYIEVDNNWGLVSFGLTQGIEVYVTQANDKGFNATTAGFGLGNLVGRFGMLVDLDSRTIQAVDANCAVTSASVALDASVGYTPYFYSHFNTASNTTQSVNFGQYPMRCSFPGYQNGWFTQ